MPCPSLLFRTEEETHAGPRIGHVASSGKARSLVRQDVTISRLIAVKSVDAESSCRRVVKVDHYAIRHHFTIYQNLDLVESDRSHQESYGVQCIGKLFKSVTDQ